MNTRALLSAALQLLSVVAWLRADVVILQDGQRLEGQIIDENEQEVSLRQSSSIAGLAYIRKIHRFRIREVQKGQTPGSQPTSAPADIEEPVPAATPVHPGNEKIELLESALAKYDQGNYPWAGFLLTRLINTSSPGELAYLSADVHKRKNMSLAELAAVCHFKAAEPARPGQRVRLPYVTHYERPAMVKLLKRAHEEALGKTLEIPEPQAAPAATESTLANRPQPEAVGRQKQSIEQWREEPGKPTDKQPPAPATPAPQPAAQTPPASPPTPADPSPTARRGSPAPQEPVAVSPIASRPAAWPPRRPATAIDWLDRPEEYDGPPSEAESLVKHIQYTTSLLSERIRLDPKVQRDPALKTALIQEKERLGLLLRAAKAQARGALTPNERAAILAERKRLETSHRKEIRSRELLIDEFVNEGRKSGPPPGKYPTTTGSGNVNLVPVDVNFP